MNRLLFRYGVMALMTALLVPQAPARAPDEPGSLATRPKSIKMRTCRRTSSSADACCLSAFFAMAGTVNVEAAELCHCPNHDGTYIVKFEMTRYVNDKPSVRRAIEPFYYRRDQ